jgi:hypothetical protein
MLSFNAWSWSHHSLHAAGPVCKQWSLEQPHSAVTDSWVWGLQSCFPPPPPLPALAGSPGHGPAPRRGSSHSRLIEERLCGVSLSDHLPLFGIQSSRSYRLMSAFLSFHDFFNFRSFLVPTYLTFSGGESVWIKGL